MSYLRLLTLLSFVAFFMPQAGLAQQADGSAAVEDLNNMSLEDLLNIKVSVASKTAESVSEASSSVTVFTHAEMKRMGIRKLEDIFNYVPGFFATRNSALFTLNRIGVRGTNGPMNETILFLLDGHRMNDVYSGGAALTNRNMTIENVSRVEVIRGPGSALYGSNAFMGVVNIITEKSKNNAVVRAGEHNAKFTAANFSTPLDNGGRVYGSVSFSKEDGEEFTTKSNDLAPPPLGPGNITQTHTTTDPQSGNDVTFGAEMHNFSIDFRHTERNLKKGMVIGYFADDINNEDVSQDLASIKYKSKLTEKLDMEASAGYSKSYWSILARIMPYSLTGLFGTEPYIGGTKMTVQSTNVALDFRYTPPIENNEIVAGVSYERPEITDAVSLANFVPSTVLDGPPFTPTPNHDIVEFSGSESFMNEKSREVMGVYLQDTHNFSDGLKAVVGVRYDEYSDFGSTTNPRLAIVKKSPWTSGSFKVMYGEAFRAPSFIQLYSNPTPQIVGNPDLKAEKVKTTEVAYTHTWDKGEASVTYFQNDISDKLEFAADKMYHNTGAESPNGFELSTKFGVGGNTTINAQYTQVMADESDATPKSNAGVIVNYGRGKWNYNVSAVYTGEFDYTSGSVTGLDTKSDASTIYNGSVMYSLNKGVDLQFMALNLLDEETSDCSISNGGALQYLQPNRGREMFAQVRMDF